MTVALLAVIGTLFIPLPPAAMSVLVLINIAISILVLVTALMVRDPAQLTVFPSILLLTTVFRLAISIAITRNILTYADAGGVVEALGEVTAQGNIITGAVIFVIVLVVQYLVVGKGAERIAEVAARFSLDAMPGKQMSIDADLNAGLISTEEAIEQRQDLRREASMFGAMDGAMKFVRNDSIATIVIALVNITAGLAIGISSGMEPAEAASVYTILTFGDGIAAVIGSLLVTVAAGVVVSRISDESEESTMASDIAAQFFSNPLPLYITGAVLVFLTPLNYLFAAVGLFVIGAGYLVSRHNRQLELVEDQGQNELEPAKLVPIELGFGKGLKSFSDPSSSDHEHLTELINEVRSKIYKELGVLLPVVEISLTDSVAEDEYFIAVREIPIAKGTLDNGKVLVKAGEEQLEPLGIQDFRTVVLPETSSQGAWVEKTYESTLRSAGLPFAKGIEVIASHLSLVMRRNAFEFIGVDETKGLLDFVKNDSPNVVDETVPRILDLPKLTEVFRLLVRDGVSVKDARSILEILARDGDKQMTTREVVEKIRSGLSRQITYSLSQGKDTLYVILVDDELEGLIAESVRMGDDSRETPILSPGVVSEVFDSLRSVLEDSGSRANVIATDPRVRAGFASLIRTEFPGILVVSLNELTPETNIQPVGKIMAHSGLRKITSMRDEITELPGPSMPLES